MFERYSLMLIDVEDFITGGESKRPHRMLKKFSGGKVGGQGGM